LTPFRAPEQAAGYEERRGAESIHRPTLAVWEPSLHQTRGGPGRGELIDHIFASHRLVNPANLPAVETVRNPAPLPSMGDDPSSRRNLAGSDHAAVCATFDP